MKDLVSQLQDAEKDASPAEAHGYQPRQLILVGAGLAHLQVLAALAARPLAQVRVTLLSPFTRTLHPHMLAGLVAGDYEAQDCAIPIEPLVRRAGIRWLQRKVKALDTTQRTLLLDDGSTQRYEWLSIDSAGMQNRDALEQTMPGVREHGLFIYPSETFATLWPRVCEMAQSRALRIAVIGHSALSMELALAVRQRMPQAAMTWVAGNSPSAPLPVPEQRLLQALRQQGITVLHDEVNGLNGEEVLLGCGARLACDVPLIAVDAPTAPWMTTSGLACDATGALQTDAYHRSTSHPNIVVAHGHGKNLASYLSATTLSHPLPPPTTASHRQLHFGGTQGAIAHWGAYHMQGRLWTWLKRWADLRERNGLTVTDSRATP